MQYLILAILSSAMISLLMRLSTDKVKNNVGMLAVNYLTCLIVAGAYTGVDKLFPADPALPNAVWLGGLQGALYLTNFVLLQMNVQRSGVVLSSLFMKLGLLVPFVVSILFFHESPTGLQITGFVTAAAAIVLFNVKKDADVGRFGIGLILLLLINGAADTLVKVFEEAGPEQLSDHFLCFSFTVAFLLSVGFIIGRKERPEGSALLYGGIIGVVNFFSFKFLLGALAQIPAVVVFPTFSVATMLVVTLSGVLFFIELLQKRQWLAFAAVIAALVMLNI